MRKIVLAAALTGSALGLAACSGATEEAADTAEETMADTESVADEAMAEGEEAAAEGEAMAEDAMAEGEEAAEEVAEEAAE